MPLEDYDPVRFILGKVHDFSKYKNENYVVNDGVIYNEQEKVDFEIQTQQRPEEGLAQNVETSADFYIRLNKTQNESLFPSEQHPLQDRTSGAREEDIAYPSIVQFYKDLYKNQDTIYCDDTFKAPAGFFAKEADGLNMVLPDLASVQTFIPDMLTYSDTRADYENFYEDSDLDCRLKKSVYEKYSEEYNERPDNCPDGEFVKVHKFPAHQVQELNQISNYAIPSGPDSQLTSFQRIFKREYKFYNKISFNTNHDSNVASKLKELNLDSLVLGIIDTESPDKKRIYSQFIDEKIENYQGISDNDGVSENVRLNSYDRLLLNINCYLNPNLPCTVRNAKLPLVLDPATFPLSFADEHLWKQEYQQYHIEQGDLSLFSQIKQGKEGEFKTWLMNYTSENRNGYHDMLKGKINKSEVIAYRLEKRLAETGEVLQNFYFFNDPDTERINFIDTQINFGERYTYSIHLVNFVNILEYKYRMQETINRPNAFDIRFMQGRVTYNIRTFVQRPSHRIIESPYFQQDLLVSDAPPLPPDVTFLPWETLSENLAFFWFTPRLGELFEKPIAIMESDNEIIQRTKLAQNVGIYRNQEIYYKSDSDPTHYQMLILEEPPNSYQDFINSHFHEATISAPTLLVRFEPNKDYYMTFRARDLGGISNPTKVFRYRINSYGDGIEHEIEEYSFEQVAHQRLVQFDQMVAISPNREQRTVNFSNGEQYSHLQENLPELLQTTRGLNGLSIGQSDEELWNKTFVFEIVSEETGKRVRVEATWKQIVESQNDRASFIDAEDSARSVLGSTATGKCMTVVRDRTYLENERRSNAATRTAAGINVDRGSSPLPTRANSTSDTPAVTLGDLLRAREAMNNDSGDY